MKTRQFLLCINIFLISSLYAAPNAIKAVKSELIALTEHVRGMVCDYQNGKLATSLVEHYLDEKNYVQTKNSLSAEQHARILASAERFDDVVRSANPISINASFVNFCNEIMNVRQIVCNGTVAAARKVIKKDPVAVKNNSHQIPIASNVTKKQDVDAVLPDLLRSMSEGDQKQFNDMMAALANPEASVFDVLLENKGKIGMGLVTLYALFAKANDWPPYDKKPKPIQVTWRMWLADQAAQLNDTILMMGG